MKYAFFPGCKIPFYLKEYEISSRSVLDLLGVEWVDMEFNCCGYPVRNLNVESFVLSAARNLALAEQRNLNILTPCKCCFGSLKHADHWLREREDLKWDINEALQQEGLRWEGKAEVRHLLSVLAEDVGLDEIKQHVKRPYPGLSVAAHYGCHALRPGNIVQFDNPIAPTIFENLVSVTGARSVVWSRRLECCGHPLWEKNNQLSQDLMKKKVSDARQSGADCLCTACTYCQIQFETVQKAVYVQGVESLPLPSILYPQLLGLSLGIPETALGMQEGMPDIRGLR